MIALIQSRARPTLVMVGVLGLALKDHGRVRTVNGLCARDPRVVLRAWLWATKTLQGPSGAMVLQGQAATHKRGAHPPIRARPALVSGGTPRAPAAREPASGATAPGGVQPGVARARARSIRSCSARAARPARRPSPVHRRASGQTWGSGPAAGLATRRGRTGGATGDAPRRRPPVYGTQWRVSRNTCGTSVSNRGPVARGAGRAL